MGWAHFPRKFLFCAVGLCNDTDVQAVFIHRGVEAADHIFGELIYGHIGAEGLAAHQNGLCFRKGNTAAQCNGGQAGFGGFVVKNVLLRAQIRQLQNELEKKNEEKNPE